ncbi:UDP-2,3-diacylglucosamine diphosphatase [Ideonella sp. DXS29W]|uniref:UDP-2,3-diacylglucosamine hydrolase n=1 Tax=Ideonella lacteola TaxID=2984193 RepID=A0ABU9BW84_9BURK
MPARIDLPPSTRTVDFISDLHLCPELPRTLALLRHYLERTSADAVFILGDLFEAWVGDDAATLPFEADCVSLLAAAARQRPVYVMRGNRDFLLGPAFFQATGAIDLPDPVALHAPGLSAQPVLLSHGDALCLSDTAYQQFRAQVRQPAWQQAFLAKPLDERQAIGAQMRAASREHQRQQADTPHGQASAPVTYADADPALAQQWLAESDAQVLIHGHTHRPQTEHHASGWTRHVLCDWEVDHHQPPRAEVLRWSDRGFQRLDPAAA